MFCGLPQRCWGQQVMLALVSIVGGECVLTASAKEKSWSPVYALEVTMHFMPAAFAASTPSWLSSITTHLE